MRGRRGYRGRGIRIRLFSESIFSREMRLWLLRRFLYRSLMCFWVWGDRGVGMVIGFLELKVGFGAAGIDFRG